MSMKAPDYPDDEKRGGEGKRGAHLEGVFFEDLEKEVDRLFDRHFLVSVENLSKEAFEAAVRALAYLFLHLSTHDTRRVTQHPTFRLLLRETLKKDHVRGLGAAVESPVLSSTTTNTRRDVYERLCLAGPHENEKGGWRSSLVHRGKVVEEDLAKSEAGSQVGVDSLLNSR